MSRHEAEILRFIFRKRNAATVLVAVIIVLSSQEILFYPGVTSARIAFLLSFLLCMIMWNQGAKKIRFSVEDIYIVNGLIIFSLGFTLAYLASYILSTRNPTLNEYFSVLIGIYLFLLIYAYSASNNSNFKLLYFLVSLGLTIYSAIAVYEIIKSVDFKLALNSPWLFRHALNELPSGLSRYVNGLVYLLLITISSRLYLTNSLSGLSKYLTDWSIILSLFIVLISMSRQAYLIFFILLIIVLINRLLVQPKSFLKIVTRISVIGFLLYIAISATGFSFDWIISRWKGLFDLNFDESIGLRLKYISMVSNALQDNPYLGRGPGTAAEFIGGYPHNSYLDVAITTGLFGLLALFMFLSVIFLVSAKGKFGLLGELRGSVRNCSLLLVTFIMPIFNDLIFNPGYWVTIATILSLRFTPDSFSRNFSYQS